MRETLTLLGQAFVQQNPDVSITLAEDQPDFAPTLAQASDLGDILLLTGVPYGQASLLAQYAEQGFLVPLDERLDQPGVNKADFLPNLWNSVTYSGKVWALPLLVRAWAIGVDASRQNPEHVRAQLGNWDTFTLWTSTQDLDTDGDSVADTSRVGATISPMIVWEALFLARGGNPDDPASFNPDSKPWKAAGVAFRKLLDGNRVLFRRSKAQGLADALPAAAVQFVHSDAGGVAALPLLRRKEPNWALLAAPGSGYLPPLDTTVVAVRRSTVEREDAAWRFVAFLTSAETVAAVYPSNNLVPLRRSVVLAVNNPDVNVFAAQVERTKFPAPLRNDSPHYETLLAELNAARDAAMAEW